MGGSTSSGQGLRLTIELVPETCWYSNLRSALPRAAWDRLRRDVYARFGHRCGICGAGGRLHCHEVWRYDDVMHRQTLAGFLALCVWCHHVKHIGFAQVLAARGQLDYEAVVAHFLRVNGCDRATFEQHRRQAFAEWQVRSRFTWETDLGLAAAGGESRV